MRVISEGLPEATDYFGVIRTILGVTDCIIVEHGAPGTMTYTQLSYNAMNRESIQDRIFSSGVDENDVVMGSDTHLADAVQWVDRTYHPAAIAVVATAITAVIGLDIEGFCHKLQPKIAARLIPFPSGGFRGTYFSGIAEGSTALIDAFMKSGFAEREDLSVNIIGPTGEIFNIASDLAELRRILGLMKIPVNSVFPYVCTTDGIASLPQARLNLVTRDALLPLGEHIHSVTGQEYHYGLPMGIRGTIQWIREISQILGIPYPEKMVTQEIAHYGFALPEVFSRIQPYEHFAAVIACPYEYALGLSRIVTEDWGLCISAVILPEKPCFPDYEDAFARVGVQEICISPTDKRFSQILRDKAPQILFGNTYHLDLGNTVPIRIHAASPTPDILTLYDGTPFIGFKGYACLTQLLVNEAGAHKEVFSI
jgi:Nitrogenase molybdenum-iron protein, alpha and beta chains